MEDLLCLLLFSSKILTTESVQKYLYNEPIHSKGIIFLTIER